MSGPFKTKSATPPPPQGPIVWLSADLTKYNPKLTPGIRGVVIGRSSPGFREVRFDCGVTVSVAIGSLRTSAVAKVARDSEPDDEQGDGIPKWGAV